MWFVYGLYNPLADKIYIGQTENIEKRLFEHNQKLGNHFTAKYKGEWILIYKEEADSRSDAIKREKQLKSFRGRQFIKQQIPCSPSAGGQVAVNDFLPSKSPVAQR